MAFIPARGGSKGLVGKNLREVAGKSLVRRAVEVARAAGLTQVVVSSDDERILTEAAACGAEPVRRPDELAQDETTTLAVLRHHLAERGDADGLLLLQPTSPLRSVVDVQACLAALGEAESAATVTVDAHPPSWSFRLSERGALDPLLGWDAVAARRQDAPATYRLNGAVYAVRTEVIERGDPLVGPGTIGVVMPPERSVDVDDELDLALARLLAADEQAPA